MILKDFLTSQMFQFLNLKCSGMCHLLKLVSSPEAIKIRISGRKGLNSLCAKYSSDFQKLEKKLRVGIKRFKELNLSNKWAEEKLWILSLKLVHDEAKSDSDKKIFARNYYE